MRPDPVARRLRDYAAVQPAQQLFARTRGAGIDYFGKRFAAGAGTVLTSLVALGNGLSYLRAVCDTAEEESLLGIRANKDAFKFCFNLSDRATEKYAEGMPLSVHAPLEVHLQPLTVIAELVPPHAHGRFVGLLATGTFMRELAADLGLADEIRPASLPARREPWVVSTRLSAEARTALLLMEACPLNGRLLRLYLEGKALEVIALVVSRMYPGSGVMRGAQLRPRDRSRMYEVHDLVESRLDDLPSLRELARAAGMSATSFKNAWRAVFGMPVYEYARMRRLDLARSLLTQGDLSVSEVADRVGYQSLGWFGISFKRQFGALPSEIFNGRERRPHV